MGKRGNEVARYYDSNTRRFLTFGRGRRSRAIHRELWGPGVASPDAALTHADELVAGVVAERVSRPSPLIVDLGCGVGGTLLHLAERFPSARLRGITLSEAQHRIATGLVRERGVEERCAIELGDFQRVPGRQDADLVLAIESFGHGTSPDAFLEAAGSHLRDGGLVVVLDDFVAEGAAWSRTLRTFQRGWRLPSLCRVSELAAAASELGFTVADQRDLTPLIPLTRPRDRVVAVAAPLFDHLGLVGIPFFANLIGGNALRRSLRAGTIEYRMLVLERTKGRSA